MQKLILWSILALICASLGCKKQSVSIDDAVNLIQSARSYYIDSIPTVDNNIITGRAALEKSLDWDKATIVVKEKREAVLVPVSYAADYLVSSTIFNGHYIHINHYVKAIFYRNDLQQWLAELLTYIPDSNWIAAGGKGHFTGLLSVSDWTGRIKATYKYASSTSLSQHTIETNSLSRTCTFLIGYNYAPSDPGASYTWIELIGCDYTYGPAYYVDPGGGSGSDNGGLSGGGGVPPPPSSNYQIFVYRAKNIITDVNKYFGCFTSAPGATYSVKVCVNQPTPGKRVPWKYSLNSGSSSGTNPVNNGHAFLVFTENIPGVGTITRNVGFYPSEDVTPFSDPVPGVLDNNENDPFNIGGSYDVSSDNFWAMIQSVIVGRNYQVNTYNCTNFVLDVLDQGHIYLPRTVNDWVGGLGLNPGDLGEDIRGTNWTGMTRIGSTPHNNTGTCN